MKPYSIDLRKRVLEDCDTGMTTRVVAIKYRVSESWIRRLKQRRRETGEIAPRKPISSRQAKWLPDVERIKQYVEQQPDITLIELRERLGRKVSIQTLSRALHALHLTFKKKSLGQRSKSGRTCKKSVRLGKHSGWD